LKRKGQLDFGVFIIICVFVVGAIGVLQTFFLLKDVNIIENTLDLYIYLDDDSSALVSLMGAQRGGMLYMEMIGYKFTSDYYDNVPEMDEMARTMAKMGKNFNLDLVTGTASKPASSVSGQSTYGEPVCKPIPVDGTCQTEDPGNVMFAWPLEGEMSEYVISSGFGYREYSGCRCHNGIDIVKPTPEEVEGTPILAAASGEVTYSGEINGYGNTVIIYHSQFGYSTLYAHMKYISPQIQKGAMISKGTFLGEVGNTGSRSSGPHLHFEVFKTTDRDSGQNSRNPCVFLKPAPENCIHGNDPECVAINHQNCGAYASGTYATSGVSIPADKLEGITQGPLPSKYVTEVPLPGAESSIIKGVVGGMRA